ncbi:HET-domain-containing protein [Xylariomycetidae sp. FL2044]|nr:HET-domain-containing protein [Xylariomycetidae sp. FL2044]
MHLLNVYTRTLEEFVGTNLPDYAILSHTWGEDEVSFRDLSMPQHKNKRGYPKVDGCCEKANSFGFRYVWIDTCCIDRSSSAELSEAINSMYKWYSWSRICFVYLADVPSGQDPFPMDSAFRNSRWFTRGWTLQELLAPREIDFFDKEWSLIFYRPRTLWVFPDRLPEMCSALLSSITGIPEQVLFGPRTYLSECSAAEKLSWASKRQTTRVEDEAYCLLGLLDVNMPLLYGEGSKAFIRLQQEVMVSRNDLTMLTWGHGITLYGNQAIHVFGEFLLGRRRATSP